MKMLWGLICHEMVRDEADGALSAIRIFSGSNTDGLPMIMRQMFIFAHFQKQPFQRSFDYDFSIRLYDPDGKQIMDESGFKSKSSHNQKFLTPVIPLAIGIMDLVFPVAGAYRFEVWGSQLAPNGVAGPYKKFGEIPFFVHVRGTEEVI